MNSIKELWAIDKTGFILLFISILTSLMLILPAFIKKIISMIKKSDPLFYVFCLIFIFGIYCQTKIISPNKELITIVIILVLCFIVGIPSKNNEQ